MIDHNLPIYAIILTLLVNNVGKNIMPHIKVFNINSAQKIVERNHMHKRCPRCNIFVTVLIISCYFVSIEQLTNESNINNLLELDTGM